MKNAFYNTVCLDRLRAQLTKKNIASLLTLSAIIATLFITPTTAFANSSVRDNGPASTNVTSTSSSGLPKPVPIPTPSNGSRPTNDPWLSIHMLDKTRGWALTPTLVLKTVDGGLHWQNVLPADAFGKTTTVMEVRGTFLNDQDAWIIAAVNGMDTIMILRTTDGGKSWQNSIIHTPGGASPHAHFLNASEGWLQSYQVAPTTVPFLFQTTDGGQHWNQIASPDPKNISTSSDFFFIDPQNGWEGSSGTGLQPPLEITHDGGKTWLSQPLPALPGANKSDLLSTNPPVFFGSNGLLPVEDQIIPSSSSTSNPSIGLNLYATYNGGQTWTPTKLVTSTTTSKGPYTFVVDPIDMQHVWAALGPNFYATSNGGQSWTPMPPTPQPITELSFVDPNNGWGITSTNLLHTLDGGRTWQPINTSIDQKPTGTFTNSEPSTTSSPTVGQPTTNSPTVGQSTSSTPVGSSVKACGFLLYQQATRNTGPTLLPDTGDQPHVACFLQAFQQCVPASITFVVNSKGPTTTTTENDFSTKPQSGSCAISRNVNVNMTQQPNAAETCARVEQTGTNLSFLGCTKSGTITFPLAAPK